MMGIKTQTLAVMLCFFSFLLHFNRALATSSDAGKVTPSTNETTQSAFVTNSIERMDEMHEFIFDQVQSRISQVDSFFVERPEDALPVPNSRFGAKLLIKVSHDSGIKTELDPDFSADIEIPNIERRLKLYIENSALDDLPGTDPLDRDREILIGVRDHSQKKRDYLSFGGGIKWRWPPVLYGEAEAGHKFTRENSSIYPRQKAFWYSDDGFGEMTSLQMDWLVAPKLGARSVTAAKWTETSDGVEWEQSLMWGYFIQGDYRDQHQVFGSRISTFGHKSSTWMMDKYRLRFLYRFPIYKRWIYIEIHPELEYERDEDTGDWDFTPSIGLSTEFLFWGTEER